MKQNSQQTTSATKGHKATIDVDYLIEQYKPGLGIKLFNTLSPHAKIDFEKRYPESDKLTDRQLYIKQVQFATEIREKQRIEELKELDRKKRIVGAFIKQEFKIPELNESQKVFSQIPGTNVNLYLQELKQNQVQAFELQESIKSQKDFIKPGDLNSYVRKIQDVNKKNEELNKKKQNLNPNNESIDKAYSYSIDKNDIMLLKDVIQTGKKPSAAVNTKLDSYIKDNFDSDKTFLLAEKLSYGKQVVSAIIKTWDKVKPKANVSKIFTRQELTDIDQKFITPKINVADQTKSNSLLKHKGSKNVSTQARDTSAKNDILLIAEKLKLNIDWEQAVQAPTILNERKVSKNLTK